MLTDEQIKEIAKPFIRACGDCYTYEDAIPEGDIEEFAREIEKAVLRITE